MIRINTKYIVKRNYLKTNYAPVEFQKGILQWDDEKGTQIKFIEDKEGDVEVLKGTVLLSPALLTQHLVTVKEFEK